MNLKRISFWFFVALAISCAVYGYFELRNSKHPQTDALQIIPDSCLIYICSADFQELEKRINERNLIADKLRLFPEINELFLSMHALDSTLAASTELNEQMLKGRLHLAVYPQKDWLLCFNISELGQQEACKQQLQQVLRASNQAGFLNFQFRKKDLFCEIKDGIVRLSNHLAVLEKCETNCARLAQSKKFKKFNSTITENKLLSFYADQSLFAGSAAANSIALDFLIKKGYLAAAIEVAPSELKINGFQSADSSEAISALLHQRPFSSAQLFSALPYNTLWMEAYGLDKIKGLPLSNGNSEINFWKKAENKALYNVRNEFWQNLVGVLCRFQTANAKSIILTGVADTLQLDESLQMMADSIIVSDSLRIFQLEKNAALALFSPVITEHSSYAARYQDHLFFAEDLIELKQVLQNACKNWNLLNNEDFNAYRRQNIAEQFNYLMYVSPSQENIGTGKLIKLKMPSDQDPYGTFKHLSYTLLSEKDYFKFRFHLNQESAQKDRNILWTTKLDTSCNSKASVFLNHNTNENELILQDNAFQLYLLNAKGNILWKKKISEKILSEIKMVDIYKNGKYQLLFNTKGYLHLLDRNGHYLPNFPLALPASASAPLSLFDYEGKKDYRVLIPCTNKTIYNFTLEGKKLEGFAAVKTQELVKLPITFVTVGLSQYLVAVDEEGSIYTFSRKGVGRIGLSNHTTLNCLNYFAQEGSTLNSTHLIYLDDKTSMLNKVSFTDVKTYSKLSGETEGAKIFFAQIDENRSTDLLLAIGNEVRAFDFSGNLIFEKQLDFAVDDAQYMATESHAYIIAFGKDANQFTCLDLLRNTDLKLNSSAAPLIMDLFKNNKQYLIAPNNNVLNCLQLN